MKLSPLLFATLLACPTPPPAVVSEPTVEDQIHFASVVEMTRFTGLARHAHTGTPGWRTVPFRRLGNVVEGRWCSPAVPAAVCDGGGVVNDRAPGSAWRQLTTLTDAATWPACSGIVWLAGNLPGTGWGAVVDLRVGQEDAFSALFLSRSPERSLRVGDWSVELGSQTLRLASPGVVTEASSLVQGPDNFSATVRLRYEALIAKVRIAAKEGRITVWEEGAWRGRGKPPERREVAASPAVAGQIAAAAEAALTADRDLLVQEATTLQALLAGLLPAEVLR